MPAIPADTNPEVFERLFVLLLAVSETATQAPIEAFQTTLYILFILVPLQVVCISKIKKTSFSKGILNKICVN
ncbi:hypothetical protein BKE30_07190 [Alkanindiges hydrocarboniclasticus]|uniref:Uncharacterized protein n=1 Tax=Alkanindiges hydrocarboniclasticus TaxID=1907941 RepID=A0A1S8CV29_9GAMM|nr:hypothetical protein BKE30_07190 [Alkanindiges hydrocarboniclasticus]